MTTPLQAQSNARNAQHSTGPQSEAGKARAAQNALKQGYCAADIVLPGEDRAAFDALLTDVRQRWGVSGRDQEELADEIATALWRRRRLRCTEAQLWAQRCQQETDDPRTLGEALANDCDSNANAIEKLRRWWVGNERHLTRCQDRLALMKRLGRQHGRMNVDIHRDEAQARSREIDRVINAPVPWLGLAEEEGQPEIGNSAEPTQPNVSPSDQPPPQFSANPEVRVSENLSPLAQARTRRERRALERAQRREEKRRAKSA